jgi:hypothetical protein
LFRVKFKVARTELARKGSYIAGKVPSFVTGANAKILAGGLTFAYASDVSYQVAVDTVPIETMGRYEAVSNEPVNYSVAGELSVVRYTAIAQQNNMPGAHQGGNGLGNANFQTGGKGSHHMDPGNILFSSTWDLAVFQKVQPAADAPAVSSAPAFITITDCRFTRKSAGINKRGILVDRLGFVGILASDDSFTAGHSGDIDLA